MNKELELEAQSYLDKNYNLSYERTTWQKLHEKTFMAGATSKHVEKQKLEFAIEQLNKLDSVLQAKYEILSNMQQEYLGKMKEGQLASKKSGLRLAKEETRRNIKELEQQLNDL